MALGLFGGGTGTELDPYLIEDIDDLNKLRESNYRSRNHYRLVADLDFNVYPYNEEGWKPIGYSSTRAIEDTMFDGNGHKIKNLYVNLTTNDAESDYASLFGYIKNTSIKNLGLIDANVSGRSYIGTLFSRASGSSSNIIENCYSTGSVTGSSSYAGGLAAYVEIPVNNCYSECSVNAGSSYVGGLIGRQSNWPLTNSYATGNVTSIFSYVGGLVGYANTNVSDSYAEGDINGQSYTGGFIGFASNNTVERCFATGSVIGSSERIGGFMGHANGTTIKNCYSRGNVIGKNYTGGFIGRVENGSIHNAYSTSTKYRFFEYVTGSTITDVYWDSTKSGISSAYGGAQPKTTSQLQDVSTFLAWASESLDDETKVWRLRSSMYPELHFQPAQVGDELLHPEKGWKRYDDTHPAIKYEGDWNLTAQGTHTTNKPGNKIKFEFKGTKLRYIAPVSSTMSASVKITIDGKVNTFSAVHSTIAPQVLVFEKTDLVDSIHFVEIESTDTNWTNLDAIDIDSTGRLLHPDEVTDPADLEVGKRIRCHYSAPVAGQVGTFSNLGQETFVDGINDFIPASSSATPNGDFYFFMMEDWNGEKRLLADRNIQHSISWDSLNNEGITTGSGVPIKPTAETDLSSYLIAIRLLTGGIDAEDKDNEWDNWVSSTPSKELMYWNLDYYIGTLTSTTPTSNSEHKVLRCRSDYQIELHETRLTTDTSDIGFRPVMTIESVRKFLFEDSTGIKKYDHLLNQWVTLGQSPVTEEMFNYGMSTLTELTIETLSELDSPKLLVSSTAGQPNIVITGVPAPRLIIQTEDIDLTIVHHVIDFSLVGQVAGSADLKVVYSTDSGDTWYSSVYSNSTRIEVDINNLSDIKEKGMSFTEFNRFNFWYSYAHLLKDDPGQIRFAFYLEANNKSDILYIDSMTMDALEHGLWKKAINNSDYEYGHTTKAGKEGILLKIKTPGNFLINY